MPKVSNPRPRKPDVETSVTTTKAQVALAFREWIKEQRRRPGSFVDDAQMLRQRADRLGDSAATYFLELLAAQGARIRHTHRP